MNTLEMDGVLVEEPKKKKEPKLAKRTKKLNRSTGGTVFLFLLLSAIAFVMGIPMVMTIMNAFKPLDELFLFPPRIFVRNPTFANFSDMIILLQQSWVPLSRYVLNSFIYVGFGTVGHLMFASMAAYPLAKNNFPGKGILFSMVVLALMFTGHVTGIPNFLIITAIGINNTYLAIILPAFSAALGLYLMKQFMEQVPDSLIESARLDGASEFYIWGKIVMPNVKPAWLTLIILMFQGMWGNTGGILIRSEQLRPLPFALHLLGAGGVARAGVGAAVMLVMMIVPVTFFIISQSQMIETMATSGMKD